MNEAKVKALTEFKSFGKISEGLSQQISVTQKG